MTEKISVTYCPYLNLKTLCMINKLFLISIQNDIFTWIRRTHVCHSFKIKDIAKNRNVSAHSINVFLTLGQAFILKTCMPHCLHTLPLYVDINGGRGRYIYFKAKYLSKNSFFRFHFYVV